MLMMSMEKLEGVPKSPRLQSLYILICPSCITPLFFSIHPQILYQEVGCFTYIMYVLWRFVLYEGFTAMSFYD